MCARKSKGSGEDKWKMTWDSSRVKHGFSGELVGRFTWDAEDKRAQDSCSVKAELIKAYAWLTA